MPANNERFFHLFSLWPELKLLEKKQPEKTPLASKMTFGELEEYESDDLDKSRQWVKVVVTYDGPYWEDRHTEKLSEEFSSYTDKNWEEFTINWQLHSDTIQLNNTTNQVTMIGVLEKI